MPPHGSTLPQAVTESARAARQNFYCDLCQKGYSRMNELQAHETSYDHSHRLRLKEMKELTKATGGGLKPKSSAQANGEIQAMSLTAASSSSGPKKKPVFKTVGSNSTTGAAPAAATSLAGLLNVNDPSTATEENDPSGSVRNGWHADRYDPAFVSGCERDCGACGGNEGRIAI